MAYGNGSVTLRDCRGFCASVRWMMSYDPAALAAAMSAAITLAQAIAAMSNVLIWNVGGLASFGINTLAYPAAAPFASISDKAVFTWRTSQGQLVKQKIPAPKSAIFLADMATVDTANGFVASYRAAVLAAVVVNRGGDTFDDIVAGHLEQRPVRHRIGTTILDPTLSFTDY